MFFDRATSQYLTSGDPSSDNVKNMREALQVLQCLDDAFYAFAFAIFLFLFFVAMRQKGKMRFLSETASSMVVSSRWTVCRPRRTCHPSPLSLMPPLTPFSGVLERVRAVFNCVLSRLVFLSLFFLRCAVRSCTTKVLQTVRDPRSGVWHPQNRVGEDGPTSEPIRAPEGLDAGALYCQGGGRL